MMSDFLQQFDQLPAVSPSDNWNEKRTMLLQSVKKRKSKRKFSGALLLLSLVLILGNLLAVFSCLSEQQNLHSDYREMANEILIFSDSVQF